MKKKMNIGGAEVDPATGVAGEKAPKFVFVEDGVKNCVEDKQLDIQGPADYDEAIAACGYGKFHYLLLAALVPSCIAQVFATGTLSYVLPSAECDLELTSYHKGALNAGAYIGMTMSAFVWGYVLDLFGRRKLIVVGFFLDFSFTFLGTFAHKFWLLLLFKICGGLSVPGPNAALLAYVAETHSTIHRPKIIMAMGLFYALGQSIHPIIAYFLIPMTFRYPLIPGVLDFTPWRLFILVCSMPSFLAATLFLFYPESPKFLMSKGRISKALDTFKLMYAMNTGNDDSLYPIKDLQIPPKAEEAEVDGQVQTQSKGICSVLLNGWSQISPIFRPPYLNVALVLFTIQILIMICFNSMRLWAPTLFSYLSIASSSESPEVAEASTVCELLTLVQPSSSEELASETHVCLPVKGEVFLRSLLIGVSLMASYLLSTPLINFIGKRNLAKVCIPLGGVLAISMNWATSNDMFMALISVYITLIENSLSVIISVTVDAFPTSFRSMAISLLMMNGRIGSMTGNLLFPVLLSISCNAVFFSLGGLLLLVSVLFWIIPDRNEKH